MMPMRTWCLVFAVVVPVLRAGADEDAWFTQEEIVRILQHSPVPPLPPDPTNRYADDPAAALLGQAFYFDERLSLTQTVSCATCHEPDAAFADGRPLAIGEGGGTRNAPTVLNAAYQRWQFWDGRADTLWSQAIQPLENPVEHGGSRVRLARTIAGDEELLRAYTGVFGPWPMSLDPARLPRDARPIPDQPDHPHHLAWQALNDEQRDASTTLIVNVAKSLAAYQRRLLATHSPFDRFAEGLRDGDAEKLGAISDPAKRGLKIFVGVGNCRDCHSGPLFTDMEFHNTRIRPRSGLAEPEASRFDGVNKVLADSFNAAGAYSDAPDSEVADNVRFLSVSPDTWGKFKTPSLRNVALTAPYMHEGQFHTLRDVIHHYSTLENALPLGHHQIAETLLRPLDLTEQQIEDLVAFLESLSGTMPSPELMRAPESATHGARVP